MAKIMTFEDYIEENFDSVSESKMEEKYDESLDCCGTVEAGGLEFYPSKILSELDPTAYRCGFSDWSDGEYEEINGEYYTHENASDARSQYDDYVEEMEAEEEEEEDDEDEVCHD